MNLDLPPQDVPEMVTSLGEKLRYPYICAESSIGCLASYDEPIEAALELTRAVAHRLLSGDSIP